MDFWEEENWQDLMIISLLIAFFSLLLYFSYFYLLLAFWKIMTENDHFPVSQRKKRINWEIIENKNPYICRWLHINLSLFLFLSLYLSLFSSLLFFFGRLFLHHEGNTKKKVLFRLSVRFSYQLYFYYNKFSLFSSMGNLLRTKSFHSHLEFLSENILFSAIILSAEKE